MFKIIPFYFFLAFGIGILFTYMFAPMPTVIYKYPTPENAGKITYIDESKECYKYRSKVVDCPKDKTKIKKHTLQQSSE